MWLTPASSRPYVSGTDDNSIWSLIVGYNGLGRLFGQSGGPGGGNMGGGGGVFGGSTGPLRLLNEALGGQAGWFLGFALVAGVALVASTRLRRDDARTGWLIAVGAAFAVTAITFRRASGIFHPYYVAALAPFTALLVGGGYSLLTRTAGPFILARRRRDRGDRDRHERDRPRVGALADRGRDGRGCARPRAGLRASGCARIVATAAVGVLLLAPASWAVQTLGHATSSTFPAGGPTSAQTMGGGGPGGGGGGGRGGTPPSGAAPADRTAAGGAAASTTSRRAWRRHVRRRQLVRSRPP